MVKIIIVYLLVSLILCAEYQANQLTGTVRSTSGKPLKGVRVYSRASDQFAPVENFLTTTDEKGAFKLPAHGNVTFFKLPGHQPLAKPLEGGLNQIEVVLEDASATEWLIPPCLGSSAPGTYVGPEKVGFRLPISSDDLIDKGQGDHDSFYTIRYKSSQSVEALIYYTSYMLLGFPSEDMMRASGEFSLRSFRSGKYGGIDMRGRFKDGRYWRFVGIDGTEISYKNVSQEAANYFDRIIDGMCVNQ
jgi:hypothetical protein